MKNIKPFGPSIGITKISRGLINKLNNQLDKKSSYKQIDYSSKLASQIKNEVLLSKKFVEQNISSELKKIIKSFLHKENVINEILNYWPLFIVVLLGGQLGNFLNLRFLSNKILAVMTSLLVIFVAIRLGLRLLS